MKNKIVISISICISLLFCFNSFAASSLILPKTSSHAHFDYLTYARHLKARDIEKLTGKRLTLKERIGLTILKFVSKRKSAYRAYEKNHSDEGQAAMILGIVGLVILFVPYLDILSLPAAIIALVLGYSARRKNAGVKMAKTGIILGWITIALIVLAVIVIASILSSGFWI